jgi:hypothetical protein
MTDLNKVVAEVLALPAGSRNGMVISLPGLLSHAKRALEEMALPLDAESGAEETRGEFEERIVETHPAFHAYGLGILLGHMKRLRAALTAGDALLVRQILDMYVVD